MSTLRIYDPKKPDSPKEYETLGKIQSKLFEINVLFDRWDQLSSRTDKKDLTNEDILDLYKDKIDLIKEEFGFQGVDIINVNPDYAKSDKFKPKRNGSLLQMRRTNRLWF